MKEQPNWVTEYNSQGEILQKKKLIKELKRKLDLVQGPKKPSQDKANQI